MDFEFSEEQLMFRESMKEFCARYIAPRLKQIIKLRTIPEDVHEAAVKHGLYGLRLPTEFGGADADFVTFLIAVEELVHADPTGVSIVPIWYPASCAQLISKYGSQRLKEEVLPNVVKKGWLTPTHSTEPGCGTDFTAITTTAKKEGETYVINGEKQCVSLVEEVEKYGGGFLTTVKTRPELGGRGMSIVYIPWGSNGITTTKFEGMCHYLYGVRYTDTRVPHYCLIGEENAGYTYIYESFVFARIPTTLMLVASAEKCIELGMEYLKQRKAFGRPIAAHEGLQFELAEHFARIQAAKWLCYRAAWLAEQYRQGKVKLDEPMLVSAAAKLIASEDCVKAVSDVLEWFGGLGTTTEYIIESVYRSAKQNCIAEGTRHAQKIVISLGLLGREFISWKRW